MQSWTVFHFNSKISWATTLVILQISKLPMPQLQVVSSLASGYYLRVWFSRSKESQTKFITNKLQLQTPTVTSATARLQRRPFTRDAIFPSAWAPTTTITLIVKVSNPHSIWMAYRDQTSVTPITDIIYNMAQSRQVRIIHMKLRIRNTERVGKEIDLTKVNFIVKLHRISIPAH